MSSEQGCLGKAIVENMLRAKRQDGLNFAAARLRAFANHAELSPPPRGSSNHSLAIIILPRVSREWWL